MIDQMRIIGRKNDSRRRRYEFALSDMFGGEQATPLSGMDSRAYPCRSDACELSCCPNQCQSGINGAKLRHDLAMTTCCSVTAAGASRSLMVVQDGRR